MRIRFVQKIIDRIRHHNIEHDSIESAETDYSEKIIKEGCSIDEEKSIIKTYNNILFKYNDKSKITTECCILEDFCNKTYDFDINKEAVFIDIGLNIASTSLFFANKKWVKKCYGFEPFLKTFQSAKENIELNKHLKDKIEIFNFGLGKEDKILEIGYNEEASGCMSTSYNSFEELSSICSQPESIEKVQIREADKELSKIISKHKEEKIILKIDTEGSEFDIFENLDNKDVLNKIDVIVMEWHKFNPKPIEDVLIKYNFLVKCTPAYKKDIWGGVLAGIKLN